MDILKPKSEVEIWEDIAKLHPIDQFCQKFRYFYDKEPYPYKILEIIKKINSDPRITWTINRDLGNSDMFRHERIQFKNRPEIFTIKLEYKTTFDTFTRTIEVQSGQIKMEGNDTISLRFGV